VQSPTHCFILSAALLQLLILAAQQKLILIQIHIDFVIVFFLPKQKKCFAVDVDISVCRIVFAVLFARDTIHQTKETRQVPITREITHSAEPQK
jgi:hypothetical protein